MLFEHLKTQSNYMKEVVNEDVIHIRESLHPGEELVGLSVGVFQEQYGVYGVTNERLIFVAVANGNEVYHQFELRDIIDVQCMQTGLYNVRLHVGTSTFRLGIDQKVARPFTEFFTTYLKEQVAA